MKHKVMIMRCSQYDPSRIAGIVWEGLEVLGVEPRDWVLVKPNVVLAHQVKRGKEFPLPCARCASSQYTFSLPACPVWGHHGTKAKRESQR
jgi:hypothetical protein